MPKDNDLYVIEPQEKNIFPLPDDGLGWFMIPERIEISSVNFWVVMKGKCYEIDQETGEPVFQGIYQVRMSSKVQDIFDSVELLKEDFESADSYLLQQKYIEGTLGGMSGSRWLTGRGIDFYESSDSVADDNNNQEVDQMPDPKKVFVVHGRDACLRNDFFSFLRALTLKPIEWSEALKFTGKASPYIGEAIESAFKNAQAVIVLLSPDDEVRLFPELWNENENQNEKEWSLQARPNVLFEAGMAFGVNPDKTILIEVGKIKPFSDVAGRHVVRLSNTSHARNDIAERLKNSGCDVSTGGSDWLTVGNFDLKKDFNSTTYDPSDLTEGDILALLDSWWPKSKESFPEDVTVNFNEVDKSLSLPSGSTKKYIPQTARRKNFKLVSSGNLVATYEYDVTNDDFGSYFEP